MPGKRWADPGGAQRVVGSVTPPRHWRAKARRARESGRSVSRRRSFAASDGDGDGAEEEELE